MKTPTDFARHLSTFLTQYLPGQKNVSPHTIAAYRDAWKLFLIFSEQYDGVGPERLTLAKLTHERVLAYLEWLETVRHCSVATRNQRRSAVVGFTRYVQQEVQDYLFEWQRIQSIPAKKVAQPLVPCLTEDALRILFAQPNPETAQGRRDLVLLVVMYNSAARVQELVDLRVRDIRLTSPAVMTLHGKGQKTRQVPILGQTTALLTNYLTHHQKMAWGIAGADAPVFYNQQRQPLSRWGISHILQKYVLLAQRNSIFPTHLHVTPHVLRHSKAMGMLKAGVNLVYIRDFLGHVNVSTTEIYARADAEMKRKALESTYRELQTEALPQWKDDDDLMHWLQDPCK